MHSSAVIASREVALPRPEKRRRTDDEGEMQVLQNAILVAINAAPKPPARITRSERVGSDTIAALTKWAFRYGYVLHYKEKKKRFDDIPGDIRHEGREAMVYTIELYWVDVK